MQDPSEQTVRWREILHPAHFQSLALVCVSVWLHAADAMLVATMIPAIVEDIGGTRLISWTFALYEIGSIVAGVASGLLAIRYGIRMPMCFAALLFGVGCMVSAAAPSMWVLLFGRVLQGLGGGGLIALSFVAVGILFPRRLIPRALAAVSLLWGTAAFIGPLCGGLFVEYATWRWGFWFFAAQALLLAIWIMVRIGALARPVETAHQERFPILRLSALCAGVLLVSCSSVEISPLTTPLLIAAGILCIVVFLRLDGARGDSRLLPKHPARLSNPVGAALSMIFYFTMATIAITVYGPLFMIKLHGASALVAGYIVACASIGWAVAAMMVSGLSERYDRLMIGCGMLTLSVSVIGFIYSMSSGPLWLIACFVSLEGAGFGMAWTFILRRVTKLSEAGETERVAGAIPPVQRLGYAMGAAFVGVIANTAGLVQGAGIGVIEQASRWVFIAALPMAALGLVAAYRFLFPRPV
jgi:MFS family permease